MPLAFPLGSFFGKVPKYLYKKQWIKPFLQLPGGHMYAWRVLLVRKEATLVSVSQLKVSWQL